MTTTSIWACVAVVLISVFSDMLTRKIPNTITLGGIVLGLLIHTARGLVGDGALGGLRGLGFALGGLLACSIIPFIAWKRGEMGGGDVKLFAAIGALIGPLAGFDVQAITFTISLVILFPYRLVRHGAIAPAVKNIGIGVTNIFRTKDNKQEYVVGPKLRPVILAPSIGLALFLTLVRHGALN